MSSRGRRISQIGQNEWVQFTDDIALQASVDFLVGQAVLRPAFDIGAGARIAAHSNHGNRPEGVVCRPVSASVQPMPNRLPGRGLQWTGAAKFRQRSFTFEAFRIVACNLPAPCNLRHHRCSCRISPNSGERLTRPRRFACPRHQNL